MAILTGTSREPPTAVGRLSKWFPPWVRHAFAAIVAIVLLGTLADLGLSWAWSPRRQAVIEIMSHLRKGMPKSEVEKLMEPYRSRFFHAPSATAEGLVWRTQVGLTRDWAIIMTFATDGALASAKVATEDGPYHPASVPPDIE